MKLVIERYRNGGYPGKDVTIVTPYMAQVVRYRQTLFALSKQGGLLKTELPKIATTDSMQGKESKDSIYDWIVTSANLFADMGLTIDSNRGNVGMSRMTEVMVNVLPARVGSEAKSIPI